LTEGARVDVEASDDGRIIVTRSRRRFTLDELVAGMTPEREHRLEDDGPQGEEIL
jgi:antitoxin component of MazEF toxin-antitoxin module